MISAEGRKDSYAFASSNSDLPSRTHILYIWSSPLFLILHSRPSRESMLGSFCDRRNNLRTSCSIYLSLILSFSYLFTSMYKVSHNSRIISREQVKWAKLNWKILYHFTIFILIEIINKNSHISVRRRNSLVLTYVHSWYLKMCSTNDSS